MDVPQPFSQPFWTSRNPLKKDDLRGVYVHKFKLQAVQYLIAYLSIDETLELVMIGPHENYYRDLKS